MCCGGRFRFIEHVKQDDVVAAMPQPVQRLDDRVGIDCRTVRDDEVAVVRAAILAATGSAAVSGRNT